MAGTIVVACPTCAQKYRIDEKKVGHHARCKHCGQRFRIETERPIDDETILGWVMEDDASDQPDKSVMGSTSIFPSSAPTVSTPKPVQPAQPTHEDRWQRLPLAVRNRIGSWYKPREGEPFIGYFADSDFSRSEAGSAGVVLTNRRLIFKKYTIVREFNIEDGGRLDIDANPKTAIVRIWQSELMEATLNTSTITASHLAKAITASKAPWRIKVTTPANKPTPSDG